MKISSILFCVCSGLCLGGAFWIYTDGVVDYHVVQKQAGYQFKWVVPGLLITLAIVALNVGVTPATVIRQWFAGCQYQGCSNCACIFAHVPWQEARLWAFCCITAAFLGIGLSLWILVADAVIGGGMNWAAISILLQTMLVMVAGVLFFARDGCTRHEEGGGFMIN